MNNSRNSSSTTVRYRRSRLAAAVLGGLALSTLGIVGPASARPIDSGTYHDEVSFVVEDTCDVPGFTSRVDYVVDGRFMLYSRGADRLPYFNENRTESFVFTNVTTGEFVTIEGRENGNDVQATDEDGILTYVTVHTGTSVMYDMDGEAIARDTGQTSPHCAGRRRRDPDRPHRRRVPRRDPAQGDRTSEHRLLRRDGPGDRLADFPVSVRAGMSPVRRASMRSSAAAS